MFRNSQKDIGHWLVQCTYSLLLKAYHKLSLMGLNQMLEKCL